MTEDHPVAFRAEARIEPSRWMRRPRRVLHFDARWADGREAYDVNLVDLMYRRAPADYVVVRNAMLARCPEVGAGPWIGYPWGEVVDLG